jgi:hypothetical protein
MLEYFSTTGNVIRLLNHIKIIYINYLIIYWVWSEIPKLKIPTGQNPETQNPERSKSRQIKIPTGQNPDRYKIPTGQNPENKKY